MEIVKVNVSNFAQEVTKSDKPCFWIFMPIGAVLVKCSLPSLKRLQVKLTV